MQFIKSHKLVVGLSTLVVVLIGLASLSLSTEPYASEFTPCPTSSSSTKPSPSASASPRVTRTPVTLKLNSSRTLAYYCPSSASVTPTNNAASPTPYLSPSFVPTYEFESNNTSSSPPPTPTPNPYTSPSSNLPNGQSPPRSEAPTTNNLSTTVDRSTATTPSQNSNQESAANNKAPESSQSNTTTNNSLTPSTHKQDNSAPQSNYYPPQTISQSVNPCPSGFLWRLRTRVSLLHTQWRINRANTTRSRYLLELQQFTSFKNDLERDGGIAGVQGKLNNLDTVELPQLRRDEAKDTWILNNC